MNPNGDLEDVDLLIFVDSVFYQKYEISADEVQPDP